MCSGKGSVCWVQGRQSYISMHSSRNICVSSVLAHLTPPTPSRKNNCHFICFACSHELEEYMNDDMLPTIAAVETEITAMDLRASEVGERWRIIVVSVCV